MYAYAYVCMYVAGKVVSEDQVEAMIESNDPQIFTQDVS